MSTQNHRGGLASAVHGAAAARAQRHKRSSKATRDGPPPSRAGKRGVVIYLAPETANALKVIAAQRQTSIQALGAEAIENVLAEHQDKQVLAC